MTGGGSVGFIPIPLPVAVPDGHAGCGAGAGALPVYVLRPVGSTLPVDVGEDATPGNGAGVWEVVEKRLSVAFVGNPVTDVGAAVWLPIGFSEEVMVGLVGSVAPVEFSGLLVFVRAWLFQPAQCQRHCDRSGFRVLNSGSCDGGRVAARSPITVSTCLSAMS